MQNRFDSSATVEYKPGFCSAGPVLRSWPGWPAVTCESISFPRRRPNVGGERPQVRTLPEPEHLLPPAGQAALQRRVRPAEQEDTGAADGVREAARHRCTTQTGSSVSGAQANYNLWSHQEAAAPAAAAHYQLCQQRRTNQHMEEKTQDVKLHCKNEHQCLALFNLTERKMQKKVIFSPRYSNIYKYRSSKLYI